MSETRERSGFRILDPVRELRWIKEVAAEWRSWRKLTPSRRREYLEAEFENLFAEARQETDLEAVASKPSKSPADGISWDMRHGFELVRLHGPRMVEAFACRDLELALNHALRLGIAMGMLQTWPYAYHGARVERERAGVSWGRRGATARWGPRYSRELKAEAQTRVAALLKQNPRMPWKSACRQAARTLGVGSVETVMRWTGTERDQLRPRRRRADRE